MQFLVLFMALFAWFDDIDVEGTYILQDQVYVYGSYLDDAYVMSYSSNSLEIYFEMTYQANGVSKFVYMADVGDGYIMVLNNDEEISLVKIGLQGDILNENSLNVEGLSFHNHHHYLAVETAGGIIYFDSAMNQYDDILNLILLDNHETIQYQGKLYVDNDLVETYTIDRFGYYQIMIVDGEYHYTYTYIKPPSVIYYNGTDEFDMFDELLVYEPIQIFSQANDLLIDMNKYYNGWIDQTGSYQLDIFDGNEQYQTIEFTIYPKVEGLVEGLVDSQSFYAFGDVYLNQEQVDGYCYVDEPGDYNLRVYFDGIEIQNYTFKIIDNEHKKSYMIEIVVVCLGLFILIILLKK